MATEKERLLQEELKLQQEIDALNAKRSRWQERDTAHSRRMLKATQQELDNQLEALEVAKERSKEAETIEKKSLSYLKSFSRLSGDIKRNLGDLNTQTNIYSIAQRQIIKEEEIRAGLSADEIELSDTRVEFLRDISAELLQQAKDTTKAEQDAKGLTEFEKMREELKQNSLQLSQEQLDTANDIINQQEILYKKEQRLREIESQREGLLDQMPDSIQQTVGLTKKLGDAIKAGTAPLFIMGALLTAAIMSFKSLDDAAKEFRTETGLTNSQMEGIKSQANDIVGQFANLGIEAKDVLDTVAKLKSEFSDTVGFSDEVVAGITVLGKNFGVSAENAAKVQSVLENVGGLSAETATSVQLQVANMSKLAGVAPAKVFEDIAGSAEIASTLFKGNVESFAKATVEARRLGTTISKMGETAKGLLDFESGITEELTAAAMLGADFNLTRARSLAYTGDLVGMQNEILDQVQKTGDFSKKDLFTQEQIAKATGMSVEEINKQLNVREKLKSLSSEEQKLAEQAMVAGLDLSNVKKEDLATQVKIFSKQQEQQAQLEQISNQFIGMASTIGSVLVPILDTVLLLINLILAPIQFMSNLFGVVGENISNLIGKLGTLGKIMKGLAGIAIVFAAYKAYASLATIPILGAGLGAAAAATILASGFGVLSKIGDLSSPADGKTRISTKEGGLFELSPNDDVIAAPGLVDAMGGNPSLGEITKTGGAAETVTPSVSVDVSGLIAEMKALRADLNSGKIAVYMDGKKVTASVSRVVDKVGTNSYGLG